MTPESKRGGIQGLSSIFSCAGNPDIDAGKEEARYGALTTEVKFERNIIPWLQKPLGSSEARISGAILTGRLKISKSSPKIAIQLVRSRLEGRDALFSVTWKFRIDVNDADPSGFCRSL